MGQKSLFDPHAEVQTDPKWMRDTKRILAATEAAQNSERLRKAREFVLSYLKEHGPTSGEDLTTACKAAGIKLTSDRAFGPVFNKLSRDRQIVVAGTCRRNRGHGSPGFVWKLSDQ